MTWRLLLRDIIASSLRFLPLSWLDRLRKPRGIGRTAGLRRAIQRHLLRLVRLRELDSSIADFCPPDRPDVRFKNVDSVLMRRLYWLGQTGYEACESLCWEYCCSQSSVILEIGANVGLYTVFGAKAAAGAQYTAVEPLLANFEALCDNIKLNGLANVKAIRAAVVGQQTSGTAELLIPENDRDGNPAGPFLADSSESRGHRARASEIVDLVGAAEIFAGADLIKLDVEGSEYDILRGMANRILAERSTLFIEILPQAQRLRRLLTEWYTSAGYRVLALAPDGPVEITGECLINSDLQQEFGTRDVILSTKDDLIAGLCGWLAQTGRGLQD
jgi:FkbM family methyltransferase